MQELFNTFKKNCAKMHKSWTIWFNSIMAAVVVTLPHLQDMLPSIQAYLPHNISQYLTSAIVLGNLALRFKTNKPLSEK